MPERFTSEPVKPLTETIELQENDLVLESGR